MMKEDYLWDKTGSDPDVERLENALQAFRSRETAPPELPLLPMPAKVLPFRKEETLLSPQTQPARRRIFSFAVAAAACLVFGVIALSVGLQVLNNNKERIQADLTEKAEPEIALPPTVNEPVVPKNDDSSLADARNSQRFPARKIAAIRKDVPAKISRKIAKAQNVKAPKPGVERLTKEEQYAYDQLMLALSITSSKFKLVKDKVEGTEEKNAVTGDAQ